ncbi:head decoration protein [Undibacterium sp. Di26W]|uniref:head decoration protein n=1 Tax=Undibacterium sp. Di26W TaxID=3413035 RepID=UPI003BF062BA
MDLNTQAAIRTDVYIPDRLIADDADGIVGKGIILLGGQSYSRGTVLGKITASGKYTLAATAATDGSQSPSVVLAQDCDATAGDAGGLGYFAGTFNSAALTIGAGHTVQSVTDALRGLSIMVVDTIGGV